MFRIWGNNKRELLAVLTIILTTFLLRLINLTKIPVFADEAIYIRWSQVMRAEQTLRFLPLSDGKQPLFMWVVIPFLKIFSDPLLAGRFVSVLAGVGSCIGVIVLSYLLFKSRKVSLVAGFIYAISPFSVFFDRLALVDSLLSMFIVWSFVFAILTVRLVRLDTAVFAGFCLGFALLTKSPAVLFAFLVVFVLLFTKWPRKLKDKFNRASTYVFLFFFTYLIAFGIYNILRLGPNFHMIALRNKDYVYPLSHIFTSFSDPLKPFLMEVGRYFWLLGPSALILLAVVGIVGGLIFFKRSTLLLLLLCLLPVFVVTEFSKTMTARYIYFSLPYFFILGAASLLLFSENVRIVKKLKKAGNYKIFLQFVGKVSFAVFIIHAVVINYRLITTPQSVNLPRSERSGYLEEWTAGYGIKEIADFAREKNKMNPSNKIVIGTEGYFGTLPDGLQIYLNDVPAITVIGVGQPLRNIPDSLLESKKSGNRTYLVVNDTRLLVSYDSLGLKMIAAFPKAIRPDGTRESLLLLEL